MFFISFTLVVPRHSPLDGLTTVKRFKTKEEYEKVRDIIRLRFHSYDWEDGSTVGIEVSDVDSKKAAQIMKRNKGFGGYEWMIETLCKYGKPMNDEELKEYISLS